ncbi:MAG: hypothetical protein IPK08_19550 [Bacteroidetes bacterium]|nr:hypothetical protein [Bacteroidota bacterium]
MKSITIKFIALVMSVISVYGCSENTGIKTEKNDQTATEPQTEWTIWLDKYEALVDKNNSLQSRIKSGDMAAVQEISEVSQEMIELSEKLQQGQGSMNASESKRLIDIISKIKY